MPVGYRHCDPRFPFAWQSVVQPPARWHAEGEGPANYFADTPSGAWAEFLRHEGITEPADVADVRRALWAVDLPPVLPEQLCTPQLPDATLFGGTASHAACQAEARRLRAQGVTRLEVRGAALWPGQARGWLASATGARAPAHRDGVVWVHFGDCAFVGWPVVTAGAPPAELLPLVRPL
jgi:hypothetical protein